MVHAADDPFEQLMEFEPGQEMGSAATSWEDTFGPAREPQLMPDERNAISPVFDDPSHQLLDDQARRAYPPQPTPTMRLRVTSMQVRVTRGLPVKPSAATARTIARALDSASDAAEYGLKIWVGGGVACRCARCLL